MKVQCISTVLSEEQKRAIGKSPEYNANYPFHIGGVYIVLGITLSAKNLHGDNGVTLQLLDDYGRCIFAPLCLFEIIEATPSKYWLAKKISATDLLLWAEEFYQEFFHDDLSEGNQETVNIFRHVVEKLENEQ